MIESVIIRRTRHCWYLAVDELYENKDAKIDWRKFLPPSVGTKHQREYLIRSTKELFVALIEAPRDAKSNRLAHSTILNWTYTLRRMIRWMISQDIWRYSALSADVVAEYIEDCAVRDDGSGKVAQHTLYFRVRLLQEMWELRQRYTGGLRVNPNSLDLEEIRRPAPRKSSWKALDESVALPLIGDAINWLKLHGEYLLKARQRRLRLERAMVGLSRDQRQKKRIAFYSALEAEDGLKLLRHQLSMAGGRVFDVLRNALCVTDGACYIIVLFLEGMRVSEMVRLDTGCLKTEYDAGGNELVRLSGIAAKRGGMRRKWIACGPVADVVEYFERAYSSERKSGKVKALMINGQRGIGSLVKQGGRTPRGVVAKRMQRFAKSPHRQGPTVPRLHPHVARKTFARFVVTRDKRALESLSYHYGHVHRAITDGYYVGSDIELQKLLAEEARIDLARGLTDLLSATHVGGKAGAVMREWKESARATFRGKKGIVHQVEKLIADGVQLAPCDWGYCIYSQALSACRGDSRGPNEALRSPDVCSSCSNFAVSERHRAWWEVRLDRDDTFLRRTGLPEQTITWVSRRRANSARMLSELNDNIRSGIPDCESVSNDETHDKD